MAKRNWTQTELQEAIRSGKATTSKNMQTGNSATVFKHPTTGKPVVVDDVTGGVIRVGGKGYRFDHYLK